MSDLESFVGQVKREVSECLKYATRAQEESQKLSWDTYYANKTNEKREDAIENLKRLEYRVEEKKSTRLAELRKKFEKEKDIDSLVSVTNSLGEFLQDLKIEIEEKDRVRDEALETLLDTLGPKFSTEKKELRDNYGRNNLSTAFLLRRVLEKSLDLAFKQNGVKSKIYDAGDRDGLKSVLSTAVKIEDAEGNTFINSSTERKIRKHSKFVGDSAAHNFHSPPNFGEIQNSVPTIQRIVEELPLKEK